MTDKPVLRVFISSPGDVGEERRRAALVLGRLRRDFARFFDVSPILWEYEPMMASGHFQDVIVAPSKTDIVVVILWSRLGTPLPEKTDHRDYRGLDGRVPVTGTEWEFEDTIRQRRACRDRAEIETPDLLVYKKDVPGLVRGRTAAELGAATAQMAKLEEFWQRYFQAADGGFKMAFNSFQSLGEFETQLEAHLRGLLLARTSGTTGTGPARWPGSPYRGLQSFEFEHAPIFFGRATAEKEVIEALARRAEEEAQAFLLVLGASGCGKSSLVKAGVVPGLMAPGVIAGIELWRRVQFRPGGEGDLFARFAAAVTADCALPELAAIGVSPDQLATQLARGDTLALRFALVEACRRAGHAAMGMALPARLLVVIDQMEELKTLCSPGEAEAFAGLLTALAGSGFVWVLATMRSDYFPLLAEVGGLHDLCPPRALYHLASPRLAEIEQMIREPARASNVGFDEDEHGLGLDALLRDSAAASPDSLPLLEFALDELYGRDVGAAGGSMLTFASYYAMGGLAGAIAARADAALERLDESGRAEMPAVLRSLADLPEDSDRPVGRIALVAELAPSPARAAAFAALVESRLVVVRSDEGGVPVAGLAHEALLHHWGFYVTVLGEHAQFLRARRRVTQAWRAWQADGRDPARLLPDGSPLLEGQSLLARSDELDPALVEYVQTSQAVAHQRRNAKLRRARAVAATFGGLAVLAAFLGAAAWSESRKAKANLDTAALALGTLVVDVPDVLRPVARIDAIKTVLDQAELVLRDRMASPELRHRKVQMLIAFAELQSFLGAADQQERQAREALALIAGLEAVPGIEADAAMAHVQLGTALASEERFDDSIAELQAGLGLFDAALAYAPGDGRAPKWRKRQGEAWQDLGRIVNRHRHDRNDSLRSMQAGLEIFQALASEAPDDPARQQDVAWAHRRIAEIEQFHQNLPAALEQYRLARAGMEGIGNRIYQNAEWMDRLARIYNGIALLLRERVLHGQGGRAELEDAQEQLSHALKLTEQLSLQDPANQAWQSVHGWSLHNQGEVRRSIGDLAGSAEVFGQALAVRRDIQARAPSRLDWLMDMRWTEMNLHEVEGDLARGNGDPASMLTAFQRNVALADDALKADPASDDWHFRRAGYRAECGDALARLKRAAEARAAYAEIAAIAAEHAARQTEEEGWRWQQLKMRATQALSRVPQ